MCVFHESEETSDPTEPVSKSTLPSRTGSTLAGKNEDSGDAVTISLAAVGCLLLLGVVLVVFCLNQKFFEIFKKNFFVSKSSLVYIELRESKNKPGRTLLSHRISSF